MTLLRPISCFGVGEVSRELQTSTSWDAHINILEGLAKLPFSEEPILETEEHALSECPKYHQLRSNLSENLKSLVTLKAYGNIMFSYHLPEFGKYLTDCHRLRNTIRTST